jgi:adenylate cyclase class 2
MIALSQTSLDQQRLRCHDSNWFPEIMHARARKTKQPTKQPRITRITRIRKEELLFFSYPCYPCNPWFTGQKIMLEIEMKFPVVDFAPLERRLAEWGTRPEPPCENADHYFNGPHRDFAATDEALRVRRIGPINRVTYKGPKRAAEAKIRTEIEVPLGEGEAPARDFMRILQELGFRPVAVVRKVRRSHHLHRDGFAIEVCLDDVHGLGLFTEVEILAPENELDRANTVLGKVTQELGLTRSERRSYLELLLASKGEKTS